MATVIVFSPAVQPTFLYAERYSNVHSLFLKPAYWESEAYRSSRSALDHPVSECQWAYPYEHDQEAEPGDPRRVDTVCSVINSITFGVTDRPQVLVIFKGFKHPSMIAEIWDHLRHAELIYRKPIEWLNQPEPARDADPLISLLENRHDTSPGIH